MPPPLLPSSLSLLLLLLMLMLMLMLLPLFTPNICVLIFGFDVALDECKRTYLDFAH
jgi:hypothetical protein